MKFIKVTFFAATAAAMISAGVANADTQDTMAKQKDGTTVVNTEKIGASIKGYNGATPVNVVFDKKGKIIRIEILANNETPKYLNRLKKTGFMELWNGKKAKEVAKTPVDTHTGATYTAKSIKKNVEAAADYYLKHK